MKMKKYSDGKYINKDTLSFYANTNEEFLELPVRGIIVEFPGLGGSSCLGGRIDLESYGSEYTKRFAEKGIVVAYLFPGPWSWGNKGAVRMADAVVDALADKYGLDKNAPICACGGSMGGAGSLLFAADSRHSVKAIAAACPCTDADNPERLICNPGFPRAYLSAVMCYNCEIEDGLRSISLRFRMKDMPKIKYFVCSDGEDEVFPEEIIDKYAEDMQKLGYSLEYHKQPGLRHGEFLPEVRERLHTFLEKAILG